MSRIISALFLSVLLAPQSFACGMYIAHDVELSDIFEDLDALAEGDLVLAEPNDMVLALTEPVDGVPPVIEGLPTAVTPPPLGENTPITPPVSPKLKRVHLVVPRS